MSTRTTAADRPRKTAIYLRQSIDRHGDELAVSRQREDCTALCEARGWADPIEYVDNDRSASKGRRPAYDQLLDDIDHGIVGRVAVYHLDRLHRRPIELEQFIALADAHRVALATVTGDVDLATDSGRLQARIMGAVARHEVERKGARQRRAHEQRRAAGKQWGPRAFGYEDGNAEIREPEAALLREAYRSVLAGAALSAIAREWTEAGHLSPTGKNWRSTQVRRSLLNPRYAALQQDNGEIVEGVTGDWPAIVDETMWRSVRAILVDPSRTTNRAAEGRKYLMSGMALCGVCGSPMTSATAKTATFRAVSYRCRASRHLSRNQQLVDNHIRDVVVQRLSRLDAVDLLADESAEDAPELQDKAAALRARLDDLAIEFADGVLTASQLRAATVRLKDQIAEAESAMVGAARHRVFADVLGADDVGAAFDALALSRQRAIVDALMTLTILPSARRGRGFHAGDLRIEWKTD